jgi:hypothetical protein
MERHVLIDEAFGLSGMIQEVLLKAALLKQRVDDCDLALLEEDVESKVEQMHGDLARYSERLEEIYEELSEYVSPISRMDSEADFN